MPLRVEEASELEFADGTSDRFPTEVNWICNAALKCEGLWNQQGRWAAARFASEEIGLTTLRQTLKFGDSLARTKALYILSLLHPSTVIEDLDEVLKTDECPVVRHEAAYYLGTMQSEKAVKSLGESMLNDPDELVRHEAAEALGELGLRTGLAWLARAGGDPSSLVRRTVKIAINHIALKAEHSQSEADI